MIKSGATKNWNYYKYEVTKSVKYFSSKYIGEFAIVILRRCERSMIEQ